MAFDGEIFCNNNIYKVSRKIKHGVQQSLYNSLRSIYHDSEFVGEIQSLWPELPLLANLRCGLWYSASFHDTCYFKSTDGHTGNWSFSTSRLNMHIAHLAAERGGCFIVDATRQGKRFPDSFSKTIPIWTCVLNRAVYQYRSSSSSRGGHLPLNTYSFPNPAPEAQSDAWDCSLHLPLWISDTERENIEKRLDSWVNVLLSCNANIADLSLLLKKPLRPLWISQKTVIWLNEVPDASSWNFTPLILVSASKPVTHAQRMTNGDCGWTYIPGAADDEESWARGLTPGLFWKHALTLINCSADECNRMVADIVERDRVSRAYKGLEANQIKLNSLNVSNDVKQDIMGKNMVQNLSGLSQVVCSRESTSFHWIGDTRLAVGRADSCVSSHVLGSIARVITCGVNSTLQSHFNSNSWLHLSVVDSKHDRFSLQNHLNESLDFARENLRRQMPILILCENGEDLSICVCLTILLALFNAEGAFDDGTKFTENGISKWDIRQKLVYLCSFAPNARPSRGNIRQVYNFLRNKTS